MNEMKKNNATKPAAAKPLDMDPITVAKRKLDTARADYARVREIGLQEAPEAKNPKKDSIYLGLADIKSSRAALRETIKKLYEEVDNARALIKALAHKRVVLLTELGTLVTPRAAKSTALGLARVEVLEAELAYQKACLW